MAGLKSSAPTATASRSILSPLIPNETPARCWPEYLSAFDPRITGLTGSPDAVGEIVKGYRAYARKVPLDDGGYIMDHTASVYLLDSDGVFSGTVDYQEDAETALTKLRRLIDKS